MTLSAHDVAAELRRRLPGLGQVKLHKLLYYIQGHHLAHFGEPLFSERVAAWKMGPVVEALWRAERYDEPPTEPSGIADEGVLNTIGYVLSRYGTATGADLIHMTHGEAPWQMGEASKRSGGTDEIKPEWMRDYFRAEGAPEVGDDDQPKLDPAVVSAWIQEVAARPSPGRPDSLESLTAWVARDV